MGCMLFFQVLDHFLNLSYSSNLSGSQFLHVESKLCLRKCVVFFRKHAIFPHYTQCSSFRFSLCHVTWFKWLGKPRNKTWFFRCLFIEYEDDWWVEFFHMSTSTLFKIVTKLKHIFLKQNSSWYWKHVILIKIKVCCSIYKLTHGVSFFVCDEFFAW
jgi:hypothetical protein